MKAVREIFTRIALNGIRDRSDIEQVRRVSMLNLISITGIAILIPMGAIVLREGLLLLSILDFSAAALLVGTLIYFGISRNYTVASAVGVYAMAVFFFYFFISGGSNLTGHLWSYTFPLFASFLLGARRGVIAAGSFLLAAHLTLLEAPIVDFIADYPTEFRIRFFLSFFVVSVFAYVFETLRQNTHRRLQEKNSDLERTIDELVDALAAL